VTAQSSSPLGSSPSSADRWADLRPETRLTRVELAEALTAHGFPITAKTLSNRARVGTGPPFTLFGRQVTYVWGPSLAWAEKARGASTPWSKRGYAWKRRWQTSAGGG
jgi:hypothetical protein